MALSLVYSPKDAVISPAIDVVAIHGLGGDAIETWTHPESNAFWLKDFLPQQLPDARIFTFSYSATAAFSKSASDLLGYAKYLLDSVEDERQEPEDKEKNRPLLLIAHSMGGILVQQALLHARAEASYSSLYDSIRGIVFFGTPQRGNEQMTYSELLVNVAHALCKRPTPRLLAALQKNGDELQRITHAFATQHSGYAVISVYEQQPMIDRPNVVVDRQSALLDAARDTYLPINTNHSLICKFKTADDDAYQSLCNYISRVRANPPSDTAPRSETVVKTITPIASTNAQRPPPSFNKHFNVPYPRNTDFTGRDSILHGLDQLLAVRQQSESPEQRRIVFHGQDGLGKTQICVEYAYRHLQRYWGVFWVDASTGGTVKHSMLQLAPALRCRRNVESIKSALDALKKPFLLFFDNANDSGLPLSKYFPASTYADVVITSQNRKAHQYSSEGSFEVRHMHASESLSLFFRIVCPGTPLSDETTEQGQQIIVFHEYSTLALVQAAKYIRETACTLEDYPQQYWRRWRSVIDFLPKDSDLFANHAAFTTWQSSWEHVKAMKDAKSKLALALLRFIVFYHHEQVPLSLFYLAWRHESRGRKYHYITWPSDIPDEAGLRQQVQASVALLVSFSLVTQNSNGTLSVHHLIKDWRQSILGNTELLNHCRDALSLCATSIKLGDVTDEDHEHSNAMLVHVQACIRTYREAAEDWLNDTEQNTEHGLRLTSVLCYYECQQDALPLVEQIYQTWKRRLGADDDKTLDAMYDLSVCHFMNKNNEKGVELCKEALELKEKKFGADHPQTHMFMFSIVKHYNDMGQHKEALPLMLDLYARVKQKVGETHPETLKSLYYLSQIYGGLNLWGDAARVTEETLRLTRNSGVEVTPGLLRWAKGIAIFYEDTERLTESLLLLDKVLELETRSNGKSDPDVIRTKRMRKDIMAKIARIERLSGQSDATAAQQPPSSNKATTGALTATAAAWSLEAAAAAWSLEKEVPPRPR